MTTEISIENKDIENSKCTKSAFAKLGLSHAMVQTLTELGYERPTPIQAESIPTLMGGRDILAQAQTGTGKTAAFALPALSHVNLSLAKPQVMVIAPTRELAIQVAEAFQSYAKHLKNFHVLPIYGGQDYRVQLRALKRGVHVIVGTPGRVMDHMRQGTIDMSAIKQIILDEADEMLKMGFIDDVEWILEQAPSGRQTALFSATLPKAVAKIASRYLSNPQKISIKASKQTVSTIAQYCIDLPNRKKLDALTRILEIEEMDASIVFVRTRNLSAEVAEKLQARGYLAAPLNGDMNQSLREKVIGRLKSGSLDIVVATDVAARGIDVERVTHVFNYDIPHDVEAYIHRIGRTGRAGRQGKAILFVTQREGRLLRDIERVTKTRIQSMEPPTHKELFEKRNEQLIEKTVALIKDNKKIKRHAESIEQIAKAADCSVETVAQALAFILQGQQAAPTPAVSVEQERPRRREHGGERRGNHRGRGTDKRRGKPSQGQRPGNKKGSFNPGKRKQQKNKR